MHVRPYREADWSEWLRMSVELFSSHAAGDLANGMRGFRLRADAEVFVVERATGELVGFVEVGCRLHADGCDTSPVGYIEAWYVDPGVRRKGWGRALLAAAESWARESGCSEMASDAHLYNHVSQRAHAGAGYVEIDRVVQFRKVLTNAAAIPAEPVSPV